MPDDDLTDAQLAAIGRIAVEAARLEYLLEAGVWRALGLPPKTGSVLTGGRGAQQHINWLKSLLLHRFNADEVTITALCKRMREVIDLRGTFIHGVIFEHNAETLDDVENFDDILDFDSLTTQRVRNRHSSDDGFPLSEAEDVAEALANARADLADYLARK